MSACGSWQQQQHTLRHCLWCAFWCSKNKSQYLVVHPDNSVDATSTTYTFTDEDKKLVTNLQTWAKGMLTSSTVFRNSYRRRLGTHDALCRNACETLPHSCQLELVCVCVGGACGCRCVCKAGPAPVHGCVREDRGCITWASCNGGRKTGVRLFNGRPPRCSHERWSWRWGGSWSGSWSRSSSCSRRTSAVVHCLGWQREYAAPNHSV